MRALSQSPVLLADDIDYRLYVRLCGHGHGHGQVDFYHPASACRGPRAVRLRLIQYLPYLVTGYNRDSGRGLTDFDLLLDDPHCMKNEGENALSMLCHRCCRHILLPTPS
jgi:hypothetical protein